MPTPIVHPSMAAGELSPQLHGRVDLAKYQVGMATILNWFVHPFGGASTRAGYAWVGEVFDSSARSRLIPFQFSTVQGYVLEFCEQKFRVIMDGGYVLQTAVNITGITKANPGVVTAVAHGYSNGDHVWIEQVVGMTQVNRRRFTVAGVTANTFQLSGVDTTAYGTYASAGTVARFYTVSVPWVVADLPLLKFTQSADVLTVTHPTYQPYSITRTGHTNWTAAAKTFAPAQAAPTNITSNAPGPPNDYFYTVTAINDLTGEESQFGTPTFSSTTTSVISWTAAAGCSTYRVYRSVNGVFGFIGFAGTTLGFQDATITPDTSRNPPQQNNLFGSANLYPGCSTFHDGRQWYGRSNSQPQTLWATQSLSFNNFNFSTPQRDSDAIIRTIASRQVDEIRHLLSLNLLLVFTSGAVWKLWAGLEDVITPSNVNVKPVSYAGSSHVPPVGTISSAVYPTASNKRIRDIEVTSSGAVESRDLSILAAHLFKDNVVEEVAYARDPDGLIFYVRDDGVLLCFTYLKEHDVYAWARHTTDGLVESVAAIQENNETILYVSVKRTIGGATKRYVERMASRQFETVFDTMALDSSYSYNGWNTTTTRFLTITGATYNTGDSVTLSATGHTPFTTPGSIGQKYILRSGQLQVTVTVTAYTSSSSVTATLDTSPNSALQATATSDWATATDTLTGLWHLEGETVQVFADGSVQPDAVVTSGTITTERPFGRILAGLGYVCDLETLDLEVQPTIQGKEKTVSQVTLRVVDTRGLAVGPTFDLDSNGNSQLVEIKERTTETMGYPTALTTGDEKITISPDWNSNGRVCIRQNYPLPATVVAIIPRITVGT